MRQGVEYLVPRRIRFMLTGGGAARTSASARQLARSEPSTIGSIDSAMCIMFMMITIAINVLRVNGSE